MQLTDDESHRDLKLRAFAELQLELPIAWGTLPLEDCLAAGRILFSDEASAAPPLPSAAARPPEPPPGC
jgi:hypothetical protein